MLPFLKEAQKIKNPVVFHQGKIFTRIIKLSWKMFSSLPLDKSFGLLHIITL